MLGLVRSGGVRGFPCVRLFSSVRFQSPVPSDIEVSQSIEPLHVREVAASAGIRDSELDLYGTHKAKVHLDILDRLQDEEDGHYVVVTGINPTPLGEGKSTVNLGLCQALGAHLNRKVFTTVRQPSQGPTFGVKGGAAGGGYAQVIPMEEMNLHLTGDLHAVTAANNLLAAAIDSRMYHEDRTSKDGLLFKRLTKGLKYFSPTQLRRLHKLGIDKTEPEDLTDDEVRRFSRLDVDPTSITWQRVLDTCDRHLRGVTVGTGPAEGGHTRDTGFDITVASEVMAVLALSTSLADMRARLGEMVIGYDRAGQPVTAEDFGCAGAMTILMKDALMPTLMQSVEGTPVFVHAGPFANIAHGNSSTIADKIALKLVGRDGFVVTEAGFGADIGLEKCFHIKCRQSGLTPRCVVLVATIRALKSHGGGAKVTSGVLPEEYQTENVDMVKAGCANLAQHIENITKFGVRPVVAVNRMTTDTDAEIEAVREAALAAGAADCVSANHWAEGGAGATELGEAVIRTCEAADDEQFKYLYAPDASIKEKIETVATAVYRADGVTYSEKAEAKIARFSELYSTLPVCMAKTPLSFTDDPTVKGAPRGFDIHIRDVRASVGAGFLYPLCGEIMTIPGLGTRPGFFDMDLDTETGRIIGLS